MNSNVTTLIFIIRDLFIPESTAQPVQFTKSLLAVASAGQS
jgi:hypothetical protein